MRRRTFSVSRVEYLGKSFLMESFINDWGEDDPILAQIHDGSFDEPQSLGLWSYIAESCPTGSLVMDIGAFTGVFSLVAASLRTDIKVVAFEPSTITFGRLAANILWSGQDLAIVPVNLAASNAQGFARMPHAFGIYSMSPGEALDAGGAPDHTQTAATVPLDSLLSSSDLLPDYLNSKAVPFHPFKSIAVMKIDVEGHEIAVLEGAREIIRGFRPVIICEALSQAAAANLKRFFLDFDYQGALMEGERNIAFMPSEQASRIDAGFRKWQGERRAILTSVASRVVTYIP